jgi:NADPH:quinone reductase-like Zn-dependent oxidoreductase
VGEDVTQFTQGDEVFGETIRGHQWVNGGAYAEYVTAPADRLASKPAEITFEEAAAVPTSGLIALQGVRHEGRVETGQKVLINGAGGGVGTLAIQIAKAHGADVTGVDSTEKLEMIRSLGADHVIDFTQEDFTTRGERYDLILDIPGNHSFSTCRQALKPTGSYVLIGHGGFGGIDRLFGGIPRMAKLMAFSLVTNQLAGMRRGTRPKGDSMAMLRELLEAEDVTPFVDKTYTLRAVPEALQYLESGQAKGKIVITVNN